MCRNYGTFSNFDLCSGFCLSVEGFAKIAVLLIKKLYLDQPQMFDILTDDKITAVER